MATKEYRLLFAEDQLLEVPYMVLLFEQEGFKVDRATTGREAFERIKEEDYDAVVLDNIMPPGGDEGSEWGYQDSSSALRTGLLVLQKMRELDHPPPVWVLTALPDTETEAKERAFPYVVEYVQKVFSLSKLAKKIRAYLEKGG